MKAIANYDLLEILAFPHADIEAIALNLLPPHTIRLRFLTCAYRSVYSELQEIFMNKC